MAFTNAQYGIERGATQVLFNAPPIIEERHAEGGPSRSYELSITNEPCVVEYKVNRDQAKMLIHMEQLSASQVAIIETLLWSGGLVTVKLKAGVATVYTCAFGPRSEHRFEPYNGPYPDGDKTGGALKSVLTTYRVTLSLLRLD